MSESGIFIGAATGGGLAQQLELSRANRHGLIQSAEEMLAAEGAETAAAAAAVKAQTDADRQAAEQAKVDAVAQREQLRLQRA